MKIAVSIGKGKLAFCEKKGFAIMVTIINQPFYDEFLKLVAESNQSIRICSPYIKQNIVQAIYTNKPPNAKISVLTEIKLNSFFKGASDIKAIDMFLEHKHKATNFPHLHAKFYVFDEKKAFITSANLTSSGLKRNLEYGVYTDDYSLINTIVKDFDSYLSNKLSGKITQTHTLEISNILKTLDNSYKKPLPRLHLEYEPEKNLITGENILVISAQLTGWKRALFDELVKLPKQVFTTSDFKIISPALSKIYPTNNYIDPKIRQSLQELRDIGLIQFVSRGTYQKLWNDAEDR